MIGKNNATTAVTTDLAQRDIADARLALWDELVGALDAAVDAIHAKCEDGIDDSPDVWRQLDEAESAGRTVLAKARELQLPAPPTKGQSNGT